MKENRKLITTLASYTRLIIPATAVLFIAGCGAQLPTKEDTVSPQDSAAALKNTTESEILTYRQAITHLNNNKLNEAKSLLTEFIEERPALSGPWANLGLVYIKENKLDKATEVLDKALKLNPKLAQAHNLRGYIENKKRNFLKAEEFYKKAIELNADYSIAHYNLALLYDIYLQDVAKAVLHYKMYLKLTKYKDKKTADWLEQLSSSLNKKG